MVLFNTRHAHTQTITRHGIRAKNKQPFIAQPEVTFVAAYICLHLIFTLIDTIAIAQQGRALKVAGLLYDTVSKYWLSTRVTHTLLYLLQKSTGTTQCTRINYSSTGISLGHLLCAHCLPLGEFLCRSIYFLATI